MLGKAKAKYIQSLGHKKHRDAERRFLAEGPKAVEDLLRAIPEYVSEVYAVKDWLKHNRNLTQGVQFIEVTEDELAKLSQLKTPHQVVAVVRQFDFPDSIVSKGMISLVLDTIQDPGNFGTIIRIADWFGISQIICSDDCADMYNPKVVQATMGSIARVKILYTNLVEWLPVQNETRIYAAQLEGKDITRMSPLMEGLIMIGNESKGLAPALLAMANERITIPRKGGAESLNAAVATGIILSHLT
jgi:RNA methyltransferase, TrmH family